MRQTFAFVLSGVVVFGLSLMAAVLRADTVQLTNGDTLSGEVVSLDARQLKIKSQVLGEITIARAKVQSIALGDTAIKPATTAPSAYSAAANSPAAKPPAPAGSMSVEDLLKQLGAGGGGAAGATGGDDLLKQLQNGVNPADLDKLKKQFPLLASPEVQGYFNKTVGGLLDGSLTINDIRKEAIRARDETKEAIKDLGPEAEQALKGYLGILDQFIKDTDPKPTTPSTTPPAKKP